MSKAVQSESINTLLANISDAWPTKDWVNSKLIAAVSAGADSVAMLHLLNMVLKRAGGNGQIIVLYCNHNTRPECADEQDFVQQLAKQIDCKFVCRDLGPYSTGQSEDSLRVARYDAFVNVAHDHGTRYVATAHHADDQIETVLFRIIRGTGISGLAGIPPLRIQKDVTFVRPVLGIRRIELRQFLSEINQPFCEDPSNASSNYSRNFIRNELLPSISHKFGAQSLDSILRLAEQASQIERYLDELVDAFWADSVQITNGQATVTLTDIRQQPEFVLSHLVRALWKKMNLPQQEMTQKKWSQITRAIADASNVSLQMPGKTTVEVFADKMVIQTTPDFTRKNDG